MFSSYLRACAGAAALAVSAVFGLPAHAAPSFSDVYFFGDSLTDTGNLSIASGGFYPRAGTTQPYAGGRFSDGPLWSEVMAGILGQASDATPFQTGGQNFAFAGARTGTSQNPPGVLAQVAGIWNGVGDPNALYVVVGGGNDMRDARTTFSGNSQADINGRHAAAQAAANNLISSIGYLAQHGAKYVLVANLPDLGQTPEAVGLGVVAPSTDVSGRFNALMPSVVGAGANFGLHMTFFDLAGLSNTVRLDATGNGGHLFGITDISHPCAGFSGSVGNACANSAFSDALHPSARAHEIFGVFAASAALSTLAAAVPEPETYALMMLGLLVIGGAARRRISKAA